MSDHGRPVLSTDARRILLLAGAAVNCVLVLRMLRHRRDTAALSEGDYVAAVARLRRGEPT